VFFILLLIVQNSFGQNSLLLHDKEGKEDYVVQTGKKIKIETTDNRTIKGKLIEIRDSSIVIEKETKTEINLANIRYFHFRTSSSWKTAGGVLLAFYSVTMTVFIYTGLAENARAKAVPNATYDNPVPGIAIVGSIALPALYAGTYYGLIHKNKFDTRMRYELTVVKHK